jgi:hypothetical protein
MMKRRLQKLSHQWHRRLIWVGLLAALMFMLSAAVHPILSWTGPQAAKFRPPALAVESHQLPRIAAVLEQHRLSRVEVVKLVPSKVGPVLQVTEDRFKPRRYFELNSGAEIEGFDQDHARWLARYYLDIDEQTDVASVEFQTEFDTAYPWVNRLLPVYKIGFNDAQNTTAYVYTEINALAGLGNDYKTQMQALFRNLHTWSWLESVEYARLVIMALLVITLFALTLSGVGLLVLLRGRRVMVRSRRCHRLMAYVVALPLLGFSVSGFYHLLHYGLVDTQRGMVSPPAVDVQPLVSESSFQMPSELDRVALNHVSLVVHQGNFYYRLSLSPAADKAEPAQGPHAHHAREKRYSGQATEHGALYLDALTGAAVDLADGDVATTLASDHLGLPTASVTQVARVTRFGPHYDFRNKRLPVWQVDLATPQGDKVFIDPATGMLVDRLVDRDRYEGYSFGVLHKWNFLTPFMGRFWRDVLVVVVLGLGFLMSFLGLFMKLRRR